MAQEEEEEEKEKEEEEEEEEEEKEKKEEEEEEEEEEEAFTYLILYNFCGSVEELLLVQKLLTISDSVFPRLEQLRFFLFAFFTPLERE